MNVESRKKIAAELLDTLLSENNLKNDAALCRELGMIPPTMSKVRHGVLPVSDMVRVKVMRRFHWSINRLDKVAPAEVGNEG